MPRNELQPCLGAPVTQNLFPRSSSTSLLWLLPSGVMGGAGTNGRLMHLTFPRAAGWGWGMEERPVKSTRGIVFLVVAVRNSKGLGKCQI